MRIRHIVAAENVDAEGLIIDPLQACHGIVVAGRIAQLAGPIDPLTHLNSDFPDHRLDDCLVAERLENGAQLLWEGQRFRMASAPREAIQPRGPVNVEQRRIDWQNALKQ